MINVDFTWKNYTQIMKFFKEQFHETLPIAEAVTRDTITGKALMLRHDIDYSLERAIRMAEIENDAGLSADYYVLLDNQYYNALRPEGINALRRIIALGHRIGLHLNVGDYPRSAFAPLASAQKNMLEELLDIKVASVSYHNPWKVGLDTLDRTDRIFDMANAYSMKLQEQFTYRSDSLMTWKDPALFSDIAAGRHERLYVLVHADWWTDDVMDRNDKIISILDADRQANWNNFSNILSIYEGAK